MPHHTDIPYEEDRLPPNLFEELQCHLQSVISNSNVTQLRLYPKDALVVHEDLKPPLSHGVGTQLVPDKIEELRDQEVKCGACLSAKLLVSAKEVVFRAIDAASRDELRGLLAHVIENEHPNFVRHIGYDIAPNET